MGGSARRLNPGRLPRRYDARHDETIVHCISSLGMRAVLRRGRSDPVQEADAEKQQRAGSGNAEARAPSSPGRNTCAAV